MRVGQGFDVHAFSPGESLVICGVEVPHDAGLAGHSDGDVGSHAVADAILGAAALGDLGAHFPPTAEWKGRSSLAIVSRASELAGEAGWTVVNIDVTLVAQFPRLSPHVPAMREALAGALGVPAKAVSVKSTSTDGLGFTGRGEGIAAMAVVLLSPAGTPIG